jgi:tetratricopeptide (TPR) repeat protein
MSKISHRLLLGLLLGALPLAPAWSQAVTAPSAPPTQEAAQEPIVNSDMSPEVFYLVLLSEVQAQTARESAELREAFQTMLQAAVLTREERLFERATRLALQSRAGTSALQAVRAWKNAHPLSVSANVLSLDILVSLNRIPESVDALRQTLRVMNAEEKKLLIEGLPDLYSQTKESAALTQQIERVLDPGQLPPTLASASWVSIGRMRLRDDDANGALEAARAAASLDTQSIKPLLLAVLLIGHGRPLAELMVKNHLSTHPQDTELRFAYARALLKQDLPDRLAQAASLMREVIAIRPQWPAPHLILGTIAGEQNQFAQAKESIDTYLRLTEAEPNEANGHGKTQAYLVLSTAALKQNDFERALYWLDRIDNPTESLALTIQRASIVAKQGHMDDALSLLSPTASDSPATALRKVMEQSKLLREARRYAQAFDLIAKVRAQGNTEGDLLYEQAMLAEKLSRYEVMEKLLLQLMAAKPKDHAAYNALGFFLADQNQRLGEAKALIEKALSLVPDDPFVMDSLGWVEFRLGNLERARTLLEQAFQARPDAEIAAHLGEVYWRMGQPEKARQLWQRGLKLDKNNETLQRTLQRLDGKS